MKLSKTLVLPLAALMVVGAAGAVFAATGNPAPAGQDTVIPAADATPAPAASTAPAPVAKDSLLSDVLDGLVTKGTITGTQKTAILDALATERTARRTLKQQERQQLKDFLADGVITQDELDQLPADSPIRKLTGILDDGKITVDELRGVQRGLLGGRGPGRVGGGGLFGGPRATPAPSTGTSG